ncbi:MAG: hypothetical protein Q9219_003553 [cf. Caloplaca sp. 3 TL-2023]
MTASSTVVITNESTPSLKAIAASPIAASPQHSSTHAALETAKTYRQRSGLRTSLAILANYAVFGTCILLSKRAEEASMIGQGLARAIYVAAVLVIASRLRALENLVHEASHNNLFSSTGLHHDLQFLYAFPTFRIVEDYRRSHLIHHKFLGDRRKDPDVVRLYGLGLDKLPEHRFWYLGVLPATGFLTYEYLVTTVLEFWQSPSARVSKMVYWTAVLLGVVLANALRGFVNYYLVPLLVILPVTRYWAEISEHLGLDLRGVFGSSRSNIGFVHRWYMNPHNDGYHAVHHLCSQVPFYLLPKAHVALMESSAEFAEKTVLSHGFWETWHQMCTGRTMTKDSRE